MIEHLMLISCLLKKKKKLKKPLIFCIELGTLTLCLPLVAVNGITQWQHVRFHSFFCIKKCKGWQQHVL